MLNNPGARALSAAVKGGLRKNKVIGEHYAKHALESPRPAV